MQNIIVNQFPVYCEKVSGFWLTEPLNAVFNLAFLVAAYFLYKYTRSSETQSKLSLFLIGLPTKQSAAPSLNN